MSKSSISEVFRFYVYCYEEWRESIGAWVIIYVGKGCGDRDVSHRRTNRPVSFFHQHLDYTDANAIETRHRRMHLNLSENDSLEQEEKYIAQLGRIGIDTGGTLYNVLPGGKIAPTAHYPYDYRIGEVAIEYTKRDWVRAGLKAGSDSYLPSYRVGKIITRSVRDCYYDLMTDNLVHDYPFSVQKTMALWQSFRKRGENYVRNGKGLVLPLIQATTDTQPF